MARGRQYRANRAQVLRASTVCHICGHEAADATDHVVPLARGGTDAISNLAPVHHTPACPTCGRWCNLAKGDRDWAPVVRRSGSLNPARSAP